VTCDLAEIVLAGESYLYRVGRAPDPWALPDWAHVQPDGTFGSRWDDPGSTYRVLYASSRRLGAYLESMAWARPDPAVDLDVRAVVDEDEADNFPTAGVIDRAWLDKRRLGRSRGNGTFAVGGHSATLSRLRGAMSGEMARFGIRDLDGAAIRSTAPRGFTQALSRLIYSCRRADDATPAYDGIQYLSKYGDDLECWALFEGRGELTDTESLVLDPKDPELVEAERLLRIVLEFS